MSRSQPGPMSVSLPVDFTELRGLWRGSRSQKMSTMPTVDETLKLIGWVSPLSATLLMPRTCSKPGYSTGLPFHGRS